ncbi:MAG: molybdenum cofactor synthesis protein [Bacteroidetes bacterium]|nr:molybdenum cofactor synthesis protein [Bacteroidota bacterium]
MKILSVNISEKTGTVKHPVDKIILTDRGVQGDAHSGTWHRQVSLLGRESITKFSVMANRKIRSGEFAENLTVEGITLYESLPFDRFIGATAELEVTQIGKKCHGDTCAIFREVGNCVMPKEGIFCRVIKPGELKPGDELEYVPYQYKVKIITLSDRASTGEYEDRSGPLVRQLLESFFNGYRRRYRIENRIIPDEAEMLGAELSSAVKNGADFIFTTGGTGVGERDITPGIVRRMLDKEIPGIMELIRVKYGMEKPNALISRSIAGIIGKTQIYVLPGSVKAVNEYMSEIIKTMEHLSLMLNGIDAH